MERVTLGLSSVAGIAIVGFGVLACMMSYLETNAGHKPSFAVWETAFPLYGVLYLYSMRTYLDMRGK